MRIVLSIIAGGALLCALLYVPDHMLQALHGGNATAGAFTVFVLAGGLSAALHYLQELRREAKQQTKLLEEIAAQGRKAESPKVSSSVRY